MSQKEDGSAVGCLHPGERGVSSYNLFGKLALFGQVYIRRLMQEGFCEFKTSPDCTGQTTTKANFKDGDLKSGEDTILVKLIGTNETTI